MTHFILRREQASQGTGGFPFRCVEESESGESRPLRRLPAVAAARHESRLRALLPRPLLLWGAKREEDDENGLGAMAMGAVRGTALGVDMV